MKQTEGTIEVRSLAEATSLLRSVVPSSPSIPYFGYVLFLPVPEDHEEGFHLSVTDGVQHMQCFVSCTFSLPYSFALPARSFFSLVQELHQSQYSHVRLCIEGKNCTLSAQTSVFHLCGIADEIPPFPSITPQHQWNVSALLLQRTCIKTVYALSKDHMQRTLASLLISVSDHGITCVGSDARRLASAFMPMETQVHEELSYLIPLRSISEIIRFLERHKNDPCIFQVSQDRCALVSGCDHYSTQLLQGTYPDYRSILPQETEESKSVLCHRETWLQIMRQISLFSENGVICTFKDQELVVQAEQNNIGSGDVRMAIDYDGSPISIGLHTRYVIEALKQFQGETARLLIQDPQSPILLEDVEETTPDSIETHDQDPNGNTGSTEKTTAEVIESKALLMPMRIPNQPIPEA